MSGAIFIEICETIALRQAELLKAAWTKSLCTVDAAAQSMQRLNELFEMKMDQHLASCEQHTDFAIFSRESPKTFSLKFPILLWNIAVRTLDIVLDQAIKLRLITPERKDELSTQAQILFQQVRDWALCTLYEEVIAEYPRASSQPQGNLLLFRKKLLQLARKDILLFHFDEPSSLGDDSRPSLTHCEDVLLKGYSAYLNREMKDYCVPHIRERLERSDSGFGSADFDSSISFFGDVGSQADSHGVAELFMSQELKKGGKENNEESDDSDIEYL